MKNYLILFTIFFLVIVDMFLQYGVTETVNIYDISTIDYDNDGIPY